MPQEAKKLAKALKKEQDASQWAGIPPEKLLQYEQLNSIQALEQLAPLHAAREHLPNDIVEILELLGKADNIPFNQLYNLVQDCANHYYAKVIKTLIDLLKCNFTDRQTVLVNTARTLKFLESYRDRQAKLWKVLTKYDKLPDHFHDLQITLQTEFALLKMLLQRILNGSKTLLISSKHTPHPCVATLIPFMQNWCNWRSKSKPIVFTPTPKQTLYRLMHQIMILTSMAR